MIALLYSWGLRRAEVISLDYADYDEDTGEMIVRGKRNKQRKAHLVGGAFDAMAGLTFAE
jgi:site-specific recombinase XerD